MSEENALGNFSIIIDGFFFTFNVALFLTGAAARFSLNLVYSIVPIKSYPDVRGGGA